MPPFMRIVTQCTHGNQQENGGRERSRRYTDVASVSGYGQAQRTVEIYQSVDGYCCLVCM
jgi:hypothetical protein